MMRDRVDAAQRAADASRAELEERETRHNRGELRIRDIELQVRGCACL